MVNRAFAMNRALTLELLLSRAGCATESNAKGGSNPTPKDIHSLPTFSMLKESFREEIRIKKKWRSTGDSFRVRRPNVLLLQLSAQKEW